MGCKIKERLFCLSAAQNKSFQSNKGGLFSQIGNTCEPVLERVFNGGKKKKPFWVSGRQGPTGASLMTDAHLDVACGALLNSPGTEALSSTVCVYRCFSTAYTRREAEKPKPLQVDSDSKRRHMKRGRNLSPLKSQPKSNRQRMGVSGSSLQLPECAFPLLTASVEGGAYHTTSIRTRPQPCYK